MTARRHQRGYLLITVVVALFLLATVAVLLTHGSAISANSASSELEAARAEYVAEAGLQHALWHTANNACMGDMTIPATPLGSDSYSVTVTGADAGTSYVLNPDQDAWIRSDDVTKNNGTTVNNHVRQETGKVEQVLTRFDLTAIPANSQINSATAWFYLKPTKEHPEGPINVHEITADWAETAVTWDSFGGAYRSAAIGTIPAQDVGDVWVGINLTGLVQAWVNGQPNYGILFDSQAEGVHAEYMAREDGANPPRLEVVVGAGVASPVTLQAKGTLGNGVKRSLKDKLAVAYQPATYTVVQPGAEGKDTWVSAGQSNDNFGVTGEMTISGGPSPNHFLIQLPIERIPAGSRIVSARMELYLNWLASSDPAAAFSVHRMTQPWAEGSGDNWNPGDGANWSTSDGSQTWDWQSNHEASIAVDTTLVNPSFTGWHSWEIGDLVAQWVAGETPNYGMVIKGNANAINAWFRSSDYADPLQHPRLTVKYACECGSPCMVPQGSGTIALIGDDNTPDSDDQLKIDLFESWGYQVDFYEDQASGSINWANYDLAYVSETVISGDVQANLANAAIGIVNEEPKLYDDLLLASGNSEHVGSSIDIADNTHFITAIYTQGPLEIYTGDMEILVADAPLATDLQTLGNFGGKASLTAIDAGAQTTGGTASGRRVTLPLGQHYAAGFDWQNLNGNAHLLVQRSIDWAMRAGAAQGGAPLLFVVVNPGNLTPQEAAKQALIESWGFSVNLIDESASQGEFDTAFGANDAVFVSEDVTASNVGNKLNNAPIGVVTEEANLSDELGFSSTIEWTSGVDFKIVNTHYITLPLAASTTLLSTSESLASLSGTITSDLDLLGVHVGGTGIAALDPGALLVGGGTAVGRRVFLPWGGNNMDVNHLNADGMTVFQRSLEWAAEVPTVTGPLAHWKLDDGTGTTAVDSEGGHDGTLTNGPTWVAGQIGDALSFDGSDDYVDLTSDTELDDVFVGGATVMAWIYPTSWGENGYGRIFDKSSSASSTGDGWALRLNVDNGGVINFGQGFSSGRGWWRPPNGSISLNAWQHLAIVYDADSTANDPDIYLDGVALPVTRIDSPSGSIRSDAAINLRLGNFAGGTSHTFEGTIDDARIYDRMLSAAEIAELATPASTGPLAHWKLDETSGTTAVDTAGGHNGALLNGPTWQPGTMDGALELDGSNDYVNVPHDDNLSLSSFTISSWIDADSLSGGQFVVNKGTDSGTLASNYFLATIGDEISFGFYAGGWVEFNTANANLSTGQWHHIAGTFDDATGTGRVYLDGVPVHQGSTAVSPVPDAYRLTIGRNGPGNYWPGRLDDVRIYDRALTDSEVAALVGGGGGGGGGSDLYVERSTVFTIASANTWQTVDLSVPGVPANAVVEIAMENASTGTQYEAGVRAVGGSAPTYDLHEAESGGVDVLVKHVQSDANSHIQAFAENNSNVRFRLLGYWTAGSYTNLDGLFTVGSSGSWQAQALSGFGVQPGQIVEIIVQNTNGSQEYHGGVRKTGSGHEQQRDIHEAESGGKNFHTSFVEAGSAFAASIEAYAESSSSIEFKPAGAWTTPPGTFVEFESSTNLGNPTADSTWQTLDLAPLGVPANAVVQITMANRATGTENRQGVRAVGSALDRTFDLQEAESGGEDLVTLHVQADANSRIEWYHEDVSDAHRFYLVGWWVPN